jgi:molybdate/tungstate transport system permease protein
MNWLRAISLATVFLLLVPIIVLLYYGLGPFRTPAGYTIGIFKSIELSLVSSGVAAIVDIVLFTPVAYYLARRKDTLVESFVDVPVGIPHPIVGVALLILDSPMTPTGQFLLFFGINFFNTILGLVVALVIMSAPIYIKSMQPYLESRDTAAEDFAMGMGASQLRTLFSVVLPDSLKGVASASLVAMSRALGEFGSISIIAFYVLQYPFYGVSPASVTIFQLFNGAIPGGLNAAVTASAAMILVALPITLAGHFVRRRSRV